jgi:lipopolysaccharide/colanic/teichoic acid biosynthesis glycosyltransferase
MLLRAFDIIFSLFGLIFLFPIFLIILILGFFDTGSPLFIQKRVGRYKKSFNLIKFRTMELDTENVASHLAPSKKITNFGKFLRKTKIDELPQLINVFIGSMSFVGPRPNLFNQEELIKARDSLSVYESRPGITGLAQIQNIDMSTPDILAKTDNEMIQNLNTVSYFKYIIKTITGSGRGDAI